jgi:endonuclease/exonuclease/phosphatase (EEP) superfamily protein YafD
MRTVTSKTAHQLADEASSGEVSAPIEPTKKNQRVDWRTKVKPLKRPLPRRAVILCVIGFVLSLGALASGYFGGVWIPLDVFSHLRVHFAGAAVGFLVAIGALLLFRRKRISAIMLTLAAIGTVSFAGLWPDYVLPKGQMPPAGADEATLRMVSFNVWDRNKQTSQLAKFLQNADADVVVLLEFFDHHRSLLATQKEKYPHQYDCVSIKKCNIAILSRKPFKDSGAKVSWEGPVTAWVRFGDGLKGLTLFGVHFVRPDTPNQQWQQVKGMAGETFSARGPVIVAGDFNAAPGSIMLTGFQEFSGLWRLTSLPTWPTWFFNLPQLAIDHIFISNGVRPLAYPQPGKDVGSDHLPLNSTFAISGSNQ